MADGWIWDGGRVSIDFLNTLRDRRLGGRETLPHPADLARWLHKADLADGRADTADLDDARALRDGIDAAVFAVRDGSQPPAEALRQINQAAIPLAPRLIVRNGRPHKEEDRSIRAGLARIAVDAIELLAGEEIARLRVCGADDCGVRFIDRSPGRNRQWCSMRRCGNRTKARRHYARRA